MINISNSFDIQCNYNFSNKYELEKILFFDIETTGLSADVSSLYLIGCIYYFAGSFYLKQWFSDEYHEEELLLVSFFDFCKNFDILIHYNGSGFDLPYLKKKSNQFHLTYPLDNMISIDLYRKIFPYKKLLPVTNIRQKTVEELTGLHRTDPYSGGELIKVYGNFIHGKLKRENDYEKFMLPLLLHNKEDLSGLLFITSILSFTEDFFEYKPIETNIKIEPSVLSSYLTFPVEIPFPVRFNHKDFYFFAESTNGIIQVPMNENKIKLYYNDYKNYYYLPKEDYAIHKSVASFVDKEYKKKATKDTCYSWIDVNESFLTNQTVQADYFHQLIIHYIKSNK